MAENRPDGSRGLLWSHVLASVCGALVVAGVLLAFGVVGRERTETVPINESSAPVESSATADGVGIFRADAPGVVHVSARATAPAATPVAPAPHRNSTTSGSGFLISRRGYVLTDYHLIASAANSHRDIAVALDADYTRRATVIKVNPGDDIALLQVDMRGVPNLIHGLTLGKSSNLQVGETALSIANPYGRDRTLSSGLISAMGRNLSGTGGFGIDDVLETDSTAVPGVGGSPLLDAAGRVIGLNSQLGRHGGAFAVPIDTVKNWLPSWVLR
ncbi:MAG: trypsin-like peptidase domain-containing protein [Solirubrobacterales bacterium]|nr:trypsin-like peptidase domain-containing protein [Solirubrobacterales bacterium]